MLFWLPDSSSIRAMSCTTSSSEHRYLINQQFSEFYLLIFLIYDRSVISYTTTKAPFYSTSLVSNAKNIGVYDSLDADTIQSYQEYQLASLVYYGLKENGTSEQSSRMSAMDNASKNAGNLIGDYYYLSHLTTI